MKKILVSMFAVAALAACTSEQTIVAPQNEAIGFDTFVDNSTRAEDITTTNIADFGVYGTVTKGDNSALIFNNTKVAGSKDSGYTYSPAQYWIAAAKYDFLAFAPYAERQWTYTPTNAQVAKTGTFSFNNETAAADQDVVYAYQTKTTANELNASNTQAVEFTFKHILSKVAFSFTNTFTDGNTSLSVYNVKINNTAKTGTMAIEAGADDAWEVAGDLVVPFGAQAADAQAALANGAELNLAHHYVIPAQRAYNITFSVDLYQAGVYLATYNHEINSAIDFAKNGNYVLSVKLAPESIDPENELYPIEFSVNKVEDWRDNGSVALSATEVATADALKAAIAEGGEIRLTKDIDLDVVTRAAAAGLVVDKDLILDGNGFTVKTTAVRALQFTEGANNVTIKNLTLDAPNSERGFQFQADGHNVVIENVTATSDNYTVYLTATSTNSNVVVKNCDLTGKNTINVWGKDHRVNVENTKITTIDNNTAEGYASVYNNADNTTVYVNGGEVVITGSANDSFGGVVTASGASIIFNGTEGTTTIEGQPFVINYDNGYTYSFSTFAEAIETAKDGETIVMTQDVTIDNVLKVTDKNVTFNLNGHNISSTTDVFEVDGGALTITGDGVVHAATTNGTPYCAVWAYGDAVVNICGGTYKIGYPTGDYNDLIYAKGNAVINIYGGTFHNSGRENAFVLNVNDQNRSTAAINVYGGSYEKFNPADNESEGPDTNFVAPGKTVEQNVDWYIVK